MRKFISAIFIFVLTVCVAVTLVACSQNNTDETDGSLKLYGDTEVFEFYVGQINWAQIKLVARDKATGAESVVDVQESMISEDDLLRVSYPGTYTVTIVYQGSSVKVTLCIKEEVVVTEYKIIFNAGEGTFNTDGTQTEGSNVKTIYCSELSAIPTPERPGYEFAGWYENQNYTGTKIIAPYTPKRNVTFYAKWSDKRKYNVSYSYYLDTEKRGNLPGLSDVEHGTEIELITPEDRVGYDFAYYEVYNADEAYDPETSEKVYLSDGVAKYVVTSAIDVKLRYSSKFLTLTFVAEGWKNGDIIGGVEIVNNTYVAKVKYGTTIAMDELPVPTIPAIEGRTAEWIDDSTGKAPVFGELTKDLSVTAQYTKLQYKMYFYTDSSFEDASLITNATRTASYGESVASVPEVPAKNGYDGEWKVINVGQKYDKSVAANEPVTIPLITLLMTEDIKVFAEYFPKTYNINFVFRMQGMTEDIQKTISCKYDDYVQASDVPDLTQSYEYNGVTYEGYPKRYYTLHWYTNNARNTEVVFPTKVTGESSYFFSAEVNPYKVDFRMRDNVGETNIPQETRYVTPGDKVVPPEWELEAYTIIGWSFKVYDESTQKYKDNDYLLANNPEGLPVSDFHEYSEVATEDRAFYPILEPKSYIITFYNIDIGTGKIKEIVSRRREHGKIIGDVLVSESELTTEVFGSDKPDNYVFDGWYTDPEFTSLPVTSNYVVTGGLSLYAKWSDSLKGTDGLVYTEYTLDDVTSYAVSGFVPKNAEYSYITLRIPAQYNDKPVSAILDSAFDGFDKVIYITEIIIGENVESIGNNAFNACSFVEKITLDQNTHFTVSEGILYSEDMKTLIWAPAKVVNVTEYEVPKETTRINGGAFANVKNIKKISFKESSELKEIGSYAFDGCTALTELTLPSGIESIGDYAFRGCVSLTKLDAKNADSLYKVGYGTFSDCESILSQNGNCLTLANVLVKYVGNQTEFTLDDSIKGIAAGAFDRNAYDEEYAVFELVKFTAGEKSSLSYIGKKAFGGCALLTEINLLGNTKVEAEDSSFDGITASCELHVNSSRVSEYKQDTAYASFIDDNGNSLIS